MNRDDHQDEEREARVTELMERAQKERDRAKQLQKATPKSKPKKKPPKKK